MRERIAEIEELLRRHKESEPMRLVIELYTLKRERYRNRLEEEESDQVRGRAKECKDFLQIFD